MWLVELTVWDLEFTLLGLSFQVWQWAKNRALTSLDLGFRAQSWVEGLGFVDLTLGSRIYRVGWCVKLKEVRQRCLVAMKARGSMHVSSTFEVKL